MTAPDGVPGLNEAVEALCELAHDEYERAAVLNGWETQKRSRVPWADVPDENKETMRDVISLVAARVRAATLDEAERALAALPLTADRIVQQGAVRALRTEGQ